MTIPTCKQGTSLIEMLAVLALVSSLITMVGVLLRRTVVGYAQTIDRAYQIQTNERWTERLRSDIRQAKDATISDDHLALSLQFSEQDTVSYSLDGASIVRARTLRGRSVGMERSPWSSSPRFDRLESSASPLIDAAIAPGYSIRARLGVDVQDEVIGK